MNLALAGKQTDAERASLCLRCCCVVTDCYVRRKQVHCRCRCALQRARRFSDVSAMLCFTGRGVVGIECVRACVRASCPKVGVWSTASLPAANRTSAWHHNTQQTYIICERNSTTSGRRRVSRFLKLG
jgi:hypothetical protein